MARRKKKTEDAETASALNHLGVIARITRLDGWPEAKRELMGRLIELVSLMEVNIDDPNKAIVDIAARKIAFHMILQWIEDLEGSKVTEDMLKELEQETKESYIENLLTDTP